MSIKEGKVKDIASRINNVAHDMYDTYRYYTGRSEVSPKELKYNKYNFDKTASKADLKKTAFASYVEGSKTRSGEDNSFNYEAKIDRDKEVVQVVFDARKVSKNFADRCTPESSGRKDSLYPYVVDYNEGSHKVTMLFPFKDKYKTDKKKKKDSDKKKTKESDESMMTPVQVPYSRRGLQCDKDGKLIVESSSDYGHYEELAHKTVEDFDGFTTDYTLYHDLDNDTYLTIFGDRDIYTPDNSESDAEFEDKDLAFEWFYNYTGFEDPEDDYGEYDLDVEEESLEEDYWFGGDGKIDTSSSDSSKDSEDEESSLDLKTPDNSEKDSEDDEDGKEDSEDEDSSDEEVKESIVVDDDEDDTEKEIKSLIKDLKNKLGTVHDDTFFDELYKELDGRGIYVDPDRLGELVVDSDRDTVTESKNPFKSHHICQGCGNTLDKCTCDVQEEDVDLDSLEESLLDSLELNADSLNESEDKGFDYLYGLLYKDVVVKDMYGHEVVVTVTGVSPEGDYIEGWSRSRPTTNYPANRIVRVLECTQPSNIGQHKVSSIDLIEEDSEEEDSDV